MAAISLDKARAAKAEALDVFSRLGEVMGVGVTKIGRNYALKVNLRAAVDPSALPAAIKGVPVQVEIVGAIRSR